MGCGCKVTLGVVNNSVTLKNTSYNTGFSTGNVIKTNPNVNSYETRYQLPNVGREDAIYIIKSENKTLRWDTATNKYYVVGSDYDDINIINGGRIDG